MSKKINKNFKIAKIKAPIKVIFILLLLCMVSIFACSNEKSNSDSITIHSMHDLNNEKCTIGVGTGSHAQMIAEKELSKAKILYFNSESLGYNAVREKQIDAFVFDRVPMQKALNEGLKGVELIEDNLDEVTQVAIGLPKKPKIENEKDIVNHYLKELRDDGTLDEMYNRWVYEGNEEMPDIEEAENPTRELIVGTTGIVLPFTFYKSDELSGYDIELAKRLAKKYNAKLTFKVYDYEGIIVALATNDVDLISANLNITEERMEAIDYSDVLYENYVTAMVIDEGQYLNLSEIFSSLKSGFKKTFIRENRYKLFIEGVLCTLKITSISIIQGTILGFILFLICYNSGVMVNKLVNTIFWLLRRIPIVVLLMVFYYIIFSKISKESELVAINVFTIVFGSMVAELLINTIGNIDVGQTEAAHALGFGKQNTFFKILLPQSLPIMFPTYKNMIVEHIRSTAIVGYIAVQDLTKVGDIVRSRTYDAFFPLVAVAIIYIILAELIITCVVKLSSIHGKGKESKYLKGVKKHD